MRTNRWAADSLLAGLLGLTPGALSLVVLYNMRHTDPAALLFVPVLVTLHAAVALRRTAPELSFAVVASALALQVLVVPTPLVSDVMFPVAVYSVSAYGRRSWGLVALGVGLAGALVGAVRFTGGVTGLDVLALLAGFMAATVLAAWGLGSFRRVREQYVWALEERARRAEADREDRARHAALEERTRIAREMHDVVAHSLSVVVVQAQGGAYAARTDPDAAARVLDTIATTARAALTDMRGLLGVVRGSDNGAAPAGEAPQPGLADLAALLDRTRAAGLPVHWTESGHPHPLAPTAGLAVYRIVQESLTNTLKHGGPGAAAMVGFDWQAAALAVTVADDGHGVAGPRPDGGHGLVGMRERLAVFGGGLEAGPRPGGGFQVRARLPYAHAMGRA
jgi:signal transduction histidine kinase